MKKYIIVLSLSLTLWINGHKHHSLNYKQGSKNNNNNNNKHASRSRHAPVPLKETSVHTKLARPLEDSFLPHHCALLLQCMVLATLMDHNANTSKLNGA